MAEIIYNEQNIWEQVLYFLEKKDKAIDQRLFDFWGISREGSMKLGIVYYIEQAFLKETHLQEIEVPMKKNDNAMNYDIIKLVKEEGNVVWYKNNEPISIEELRNLWTANDVITFEKNLVNVFEKLHEDRVKTLDDFSVQDYLKAELNPNGDKCGVSI